MGFSLLSPPRLHDPGLEDRLLQGGHQRNGRRRGHRGFRTGQLVVAEPLRRLRRQADGMGQTVDGCEIRITS